MKKEPNHRSAMSINKEFFGTDDPDLMREMFRRSCQEARLRESSFGGYLCSIRRMRGLKTQEMAALAGVSKARWELWELNLQPPSKQELREVVGRLEFSPYKSDRLFDFLEDLERDEAF